MRIKPQVSELAHILVTFLLHYNWRQVAFVVSQEKKTKQLFEECQAILFNANVKILHVEKYRFFAPKRTRNPFVKIISDTYKSARIYIFIGKQIATFIDEMNKKSLLENG